MEHLITHRYSWSIIIIVLTLAAFTSCNKPKIFEITDATVHDEGRYLKAGWPKKTEYTEAQRQRLSKALDIAHTIINDSLFVNILTELETQKIIEWGMDRIGSLPENERQHPTTYILSQFQQRGLNQLLELQAYRWPNGSSTTGSSYCNMNPKVNVNKLNRDLEDIAGTIVHERIHTFCQTHRYNSRNGDLCDLAYVAGDLTIAIHLYRSSGSKPFKSSSVICKGLRETLIKHQLLIK